MLVGIWGEGGNLAGRGEVRSSPFREMVVCPRRVLRDPVQIN